eukprot:gene10559-2683_t
MLNGCRACLLARLTQILTPLNTKLLSPQAESHAALALLTTGEENCTEAYRILNVCGTQPYSRSVSFVSHRYDNIIAVNSTETAGRFRPLLLSTLSITNLNLEASFVS